MLLLLAAFVAHAGAPEADPAWGRIVNGTDVRGPNFPAAVAIGFEIPQYGRQATCSASLITPRMLLTAAHCVDEFGIPRDVLLRVGAAFFTNDVRSGDTRTVGFEDFRGHPQYVGDSNRIAYDIAVVVLEEPVTDVRPVWFRDRPLPDDAAVGATVTSVGFGITSSAAQASGGIKRRADLVIADVDEQFLYTVASENPNGANICSGDSGGPQYALVDGAWEQWAVHSFGFSTGNPDICLGASGSTNVATFAPWILRQIEREHGTTDRCEINGHYNDRVCDSFCDLPDDDCVLDLDADGLVSDEEFDKADRNDDGLVDERELERVGKGCSHTGPGGGWLLAGLTGLLLRRRR